MGDKISSSSVSRDAWVLGLAISQAIRCAGDEKDALRRICALLEYWEVQVSPGELGTMSRAVNPFY